MTDKEVILKIKSGEINYFEFLIKKYFHLLYQYLFLKIKNKEECEDLLQEIFFNFYKNLKQFDENKPVKPYLFKIAINQLRMFYRKRKKFIPLNKDIVDEKDGFVIFSFFDEEKKIFEKLSKKEQKVFHLLKNGYKIKEIAKKLKIKENTVKSIIRRGRIKLKIKS